jgi:hypothetical protein
MCFNACFSREVLLRPPYQYPAQMIPVLFAVNPGKLPVAGEDPDHIWRIFCSGREDFRYDWRTGPGRCGMECHAQGCHHCAVPGCIYAGFIRQYRNYPQCD